MNYEILKENAKQTKDLFESFDIEDELDLLESKLNEYKQCQKYSNKDDFAKDLIRIFNLSRGVNKVQYYTLAYYNTFGRDYDDIGDCCQSYNEALANECRFKCDVIKLKFAEAVEISDKRKLLSCFLEEKYVKYEVFFKQIQALKEFVKSSCNIQINYDFERAEAELRRMLRSYFEREEIVIDEDEPIRFAYYDYGNKIDEVHDTDTLIKIFCGMNDFIVKSGDQIIGAIFNLKSMYRAKAVHYNHCSVKEMIAKQHGLTVEEIDNFFSVYNHIRISMLRVIQIEKKHTLYNSDKFIKPCMFKRIGELLSKYPKKKEIINYLYEVFEIFEPEIRDCFVKALEGNRIIDYSYEYKRPSFYGEDDQALLHVCLDYANSMIDIPHELGHFVEVTLRSSKSHASGQRQYDGLTETFSMICEMIMRYKIAPKYNEYATAETIEKLYDYSFQYSMTFLNLFALLDSDNLYHAQDMTNQTEYFESAIYEDHFFSAGYYDYTWLINVLSDDESLFDELRYMIGFLVGFIVSNRLALDENGVRNQLSDYLFSPGYEMTGKSLRRLGIDISTKKGTELIKNEVGRYVNSMIDKYEIIVEDKLLK